MPWEKSYNKSDVLEKAMTAFWAQGYEATSLAHLIEVTGIHRASLYAAFSDKRTLFLEALAHYDTYYRKNHLDALEKRHPPKAAILAAFEDAGQAPAPGTPGGCLLVNTVLELSPHDPEIGAFVEASLLAVEEFFFVRIEAAKQEGSITGTYPSRETAQALLSLFIGLRVLMRGMPNKSSVAAVLSQAKRMLE